MVFNSINKISGIWFSNVIEHLKIGVLILFLFITLPVISQIEVGGILAEDETWTKEFVYEVTQDLSVKNGAVLTIEAGVLVKINFGRGIIIENGGLMVNGTQTDSVNFRPNYNFPGQTWKWKGLIIKNADTLNKSILQYACIVNAETGIEISESKNVSIQNTCVFNSQNLGIHIENSSSCFLNECMIENNYDGIKIIAGLFAKTSNNIISNCIVRNQNHNIYVLREEGGICRNNLITANLIEDGNNGIWVFNQGGAASSGNVIEHNMILNNGSEFGYGLFLSQDSTLVANNIFWKNHIGVYTNAGGNSSSVINNSFYQNHKAIVISEGSKTNKYFNNTFSSNSNELLSIYESRGLLFRKNNLMHTLGSENIIVNNKADNLSLVVNYWDTFNPEEIDKLIFDKKDNPDVGKVIYVPFSTALDTTNPITPPYHAIQQLVNNRVQISWQPNKEEDLMGYRVYYGDYSNYSFSEKHENASDTSMSFSSGIELYDTIAVTAFDINGAISNEQLSGHESPFAFAVVYPYAGNDTLICGVDEFEIVKANIPFEYQYIFWSSNGDGLFKNPYSLTPSYILGENDFKNGSIYLSLSVVTHDDLFVDDFHLTILDPPITFAGSDTVVLFDEELSLISAFANNYDDIKWTSSGDGNFDNFTEVNPVYYPGPTDIESGLVFLEMTAYSDCGPSSDTIRIDIAPYFSVEGKLWTNAEYSESAIVVAFKKNTTDARAVQTAAVGSDGAFSFQKLPTANYYLYAIPDTNNTENIVPAYYASKSRWQAAYLLPVDADIYGADIQLQTVDFSLPYGEASISGHFAKPQKAFFSSDIYCSSWFGNSGNDFCNGGISNVTILLFNYDKSKLLDYTLTDDVGNFYFNNLPYGNYVVDAEKAGVLTVASPLIQLSPEHKNEDGVLLEVNNQKIGISFKPQNNSEKEIAIFPNPATNEINIPYSEEFSYQSKIIVYDHFGQLILETNLPDNNTTGLIKLDIKSFKPGLYFGQIVNASKIAHFRFVKQ